MSKVEIIKRPAEQVGSDIKKAAWSSVIESFALMILGILLIVWPEMIIKLLAYFVGTFFIVKGGFQVITYFMEKGQNDFFNNKLFSGVISILIGIAALVVGEDIAHVFRVIIGVIIIYESLVRINTATKMAAAGINTWRYILLLSLLMLVLGMFVTFNTGAVVALIGWLMILTSVVGLVGDVMFMQHVNQIIEKLTK